MLGQRLENLIFLMSLQSLPYGEMFQSALRTGTVLFVPQVKRAVKADLLAGRHDGVTSLPKKVGAEPVENGPVVGCVKGTQIHGYRVPVFFQSRIGLLIEVVVAVVDRDDYARRG